ncbi:MAG: phosphoglycerate dehydrogenase [Clostridia bacterium]|nr:phosphoglycerate dehydrogenase [Clostridia bacterium]MBO7250801.1 phosphoglycerate dehydrogenase [Clostridia bacterium]
MKNILCLNKIAAIGTDKLDKAEYNVGTDVQNPEGIMVRSAAMHDMEFAPELLAIARAGAGVNNIPIDRCSKEGIVVFNTPGANANGVKELAICALMLASRNIVGGIKWAETLAGTQGVAKAVEAGKSKFAGIELLGKKLGVIGLGAIGGMVANTAIHLGMSVLGCDPYLSVDAAWNINHHVNKAASFEEVFKNADYITLHVPATPNTKNMVNAETIAMMKDGVRIINLSRAELVNSDDIKAALASGKVAAYVTDFPTDDMVAVEGAVTIPHLGASTAESEDNCAVMAALELDGYLRFGNIKNSVNFPNVEMSMSGDKRVCVLHANIPNVLSQITTILGETGVNIENMTNKSKGDNAYTMVDITGGIADETIAKIGAIDGVLRVRVI